MKSKHKAQVYTDLTIYPAFSKLFGGPSRLHPLQVPTHLSAPNPQVHSILSFWSRPER